MKIRKELKEFRTATSKQYLNKDGTVQIDLYKNPIHYVNEKNIYDDIDNTLEKDSKCFRNKSNDFIVEFDESSKPNLVNISLNNNKISMFPKKINKKNLKRKIINIKNQNIAEKVKFEQIIDTNDIEYELFSQKLKESIILNEKPNTNSISFVLETNLDLKLNADKSINVFNEDRIIFKIEKPFMIDSNKTYSNDIEYRLNKVGNIYNLDIVFNLQWLQSKERVYPVIIDPTISSMVNINSIQDTTLYENDLYTFGGSSEDLKVGVISTGEIARGLLKFSLPAIPAGHKLINATLKLASNPAISELESNLERKIYIHSLTSDWNETTATWANMSNNYDDYIYDYFIGSNSHENNGTSEIVINEANITSLVNEWYNGKPNYGIMLKWDIEESCENGMAAHFLAKESYEYTLRNDLVPIISLVFKDFTGIEKDLSYVTQSHYLGKSYINRYTGNLVSIINVGETIGGKIPAQLSFVYNTIDVIRNKDYGYGLGIKPNLLQIIEIIDEETLKYLDEDGTIRYFYKVENEYIENNSLAFVITQKDNCYVMTDNYKNEYYFVLHNDTYYLEEVKDIKGNTLRIIFNNNNTINKIIDSSNNSILLTYNVNEVLVTSPAFETAIKYSNNLINSITSKGDTELFSYNNNNLLELITNPNGLKIKYEYNNNLSSRVSKVSEISKTNTEGNYLSFEYGLHDTKITDYNGIVNTYIFNDSGMVEAITSIDSDGNLKNAYGKSYSFGEVESNTENKMTANKSLVKYINNFINDSSFEAENNQFLCDGNITKSYVSDSHSGLRSLKVTNNDLNSNIYMNFNIPKGEDYTFSFYLKNNVPLKVTLLYDLEEKTLNITNLNSEFERFELSINYPLTAASTLKLEIEPLDIGEVLIDDVQLERGCIANYYNLVTNSSFSDGIDTWDIEVSNRGEASVSVVSLQENQTNALKIHSSPLDSVYISKKFNTPGKAGDTYNLSFWYKNQGIVPSGFMGGIDGECIMAAVFFYYNDEFVDGACVPFVDLLPGNNWKLFSENFSAEADYNNLEIRILSIENANDCYITNFSLFKDLEQFSFKYDNNGNLISTIDLNKKQEQIKYNENNEIIEATNPLGEKLVLEYDNVISNKLLKTISPSGLTKEIIYDENDNPIKTRYSNKKILSSINENFDYYIRAKGTNKYLNVTPSKQVIVKENECSYDKFKVILESNNLKIKHSILKDYYLKIKNGNIELSYGDSENIFKLYSNDDNTYSIVNEKIISENIVDGKLVQEYEREAITINENNQLIVSKYKEEYNQKFFLEEASEKKYIETKTEYTNDGRFISKKIDQFGNETIFETNNSNGLIDNIVEANGAVTSMIYDSKNRVTNITKNNHSITYEYNTDNNMSKIQHGNKNYIFEYNEFNKLSKIDINDSNLINYNYNNKNGKIKKKTFGNFQTTEYLYDKFNRKKSEIKNDDTYHYIYDNLGRLSRIDSNYEQYNYKYDFSKRLSRYEFNDFLINYDYTENNNILKKNESLLNYNYEYNYEYNSDSKVTKIFNENNELTYNYDELGRLTESSINNNYRIKYEYFSYGNKTSTRINKIDDNGMIYSLCYDEMGNIISIKKGNNIIKKYYYDEHSQLIKEEDFCNNIIINYLYDNYGNIISIKKLDLETENLLSEDTYTYANNNWQDLLTKFNDEVINYDEIGNTLSIGNKTFGWCNGNELKTYNDGNHSIIFKYNNEGIRTSKIVNGIETKYYIDGRKIKFENKNNTMLYYIYSGEDIVGFVYDNNTYYYHKNFTNDIVGIFDSNFNEIVTYEYDSWGNIIDSTDNSGISLSTINPFRYKSYYYDNETNLYYLNSRYYSPKLKRFINADQIIIANNDILSCNLFQYVSNNPINYVDIKGTSDIALKSWGKILKEIIDEAGEKVAYALGMSAADSVSPIMDIVGWTSALITTYFTACEIIESYKNQKTNSFDFDDDNIEKQTIYGLVRDGEVFYVGRTKNLKTRIASHRRTKGEFTVITINVVPSAVAPFEEQMWIEYYKSLNSGKKNCNKRNEISPFGNRADIMNDYRGWRMREFDFSTGDSGTYVGGYCG